MAFDTYLYRQTMNCGKDIKKLAQKFTKMTTLYVRDAHVELARSIDNGEVWKIHVDLADDLIGPEHYEDFVDALRNRIYALGLERNFLPLDETGKLIYIIPPYGFKVIFYNEQRDKKSELQDILKRLCDEISDFWDEAGVDETPLTDDEGSFYVASITFQDYQKNDARYRMMLAFYFRLLMLAKEHGFYAINEPKDKAS